jgi:hypothetical protein
MSSDERRAAGGFARAAALTPERRAEIAREAAQKRWGGALVAAAIATDAPVQAPRPKWNRLPLRCADCDNAWDGWHPSGVAIAVYIAALTAISCPRCGARSEKVIAR